MMATGEPLAPTSNLASQADPPAQRGNRRSRGPGGRGRGRNANNSRKKAGDSSATASDQEQPAGSSLAFRPASVPPPVQPHSARNTNQSEQATLPNGHDHGSSRGRGGSGRSQAQNPAGSSRQARDRPRGERGKRHPNATSSRLPDGRSFGGQLTTEQGPSELPGMDSALHGGAAEFRPGQPVSQEFVRSNQKPPSDRPTRGPARKRRPSKSTAQDIATRTHEDISSGLYECPICTSEVLRNSRVWSCKTCWTVFHLSCIKKWSKNEGSAQVQPQQSDVPLQRLWRCPGCNLPKDVLPDAYTCWCAKETDPRSPPGLPPHSCGQTCGKARVMPKKCPHPCELICHAGPCAPCTHMGPTQLCFCGKESSTKRCVDTNYDQGWSCGQICSDIMPCGEHECQRECHEGLCGACETPVNARCYCGKLEHSIPCYDRGEEKESSVRIGEGDDQTTDTWMASFSCKTQCGRPFDCGKHVCEKECHSQQAEAEHCPRSADTVSHCPCGKTPLSKILQSPRKSCGDPIPNCSESCLKTLPCGHLCQQVCHSGECMPCLKTVTISCRCGRTISPTICHQGTEEAPQCMRTCRITLNCGRHECGERCCTGERRALERLSSKKKQRPLGSASRLIDDGYEAEHICTRQCGRPLKCGNHVCEELCHKGACGSCREAIFEEISCNCGRTVLQPPLPCGTTPPPCRYNCERPKGCGHPQVQHNCHGDDESCPKCPFLMQKSCICGKRTLKNQPCWLKDARCGEICGKMLKCGSHQCRKSCHRPGECEDANGSCQQECGKAKKACGHPCEDRCHAPYACREEKPCQRKILITCDCQHLKQEIRCNASKNDEGNKAKTLKCDDECARLERNRKLALALEIDPETHKDNHIPYSEETLNYFRQNSKWAQTQERLFRVFAMDDEEKRLRFKPMPPPQRAFLHALAEDYGLDSESMDPEPHRHIAIFKTPRFVMAPMKTLGQCVEIGSTTAAAALQEQKRLATLKANRNNNETPYNAFLLGNPRFALTVEEVRSTLESTFASRLTMPFTLNINFLPSEEIVVRPSSAELQPPQSLESPLRALLPHLTTLVTTPPEPLATSIQLCHVDSSSNVLRREIDPNAAGGWSQVAAKAANSARASQAPERSRFGGGTVFTVLRPGGREKAAEAATAAAKAKKAAKEPVVDDWEKAVEEEEQKEEQRQRVQAQANDEVVPGVDQVEGLGSESQPVQEPNTLEPEQIVEGKEAAATQPHDHSPEPRVAVEGSDREAV